jgi:hypothetical protein
MSHVFVSILRVEDVADAEPMHLFDTVLAGVHVDASIDDDEDLGTVIDVPDIGRVRPMETDGDVIDPLDIHGLPRAGTREGAWYDGSHFAFSSLSSNEI